MVRYGKILVIKDNMPSDDNFTSGNKNLIAIKLIIIPNEDLSIRLKIKFELVERSKKRKSQATKGSQMRI